MKIKNKILKKKKSRQSSNNAFVLILFHLKNRFESRFHIQRKLTYVASKNGFPTGGRSDVKCEILLLYRKVLDGRRRVLRSRYVRSK